MYLIRASLDSWPESLAIPENSRPESGLRIRGEGKCQIGKLLRRDV
jgi:hypothetical protein